MAENIMKRKRRLPLVPALALCVAVIILCQVLKETDLDQYINKVMEKT